MNEESPDTVVPTLAQKEQLVEYTFPGIYWEITGMPFDFYPAEEWEAMIEVLYKKAVDSRVVVGGIKPIEVKKVRW